MEKLRCAEDALDIPVFQSSTTPFFVQRLGKNINGYFGETIDIAQVLRDCATAARSKGWVMNELAAEQGRSLLVFTRAAQSSQKEPTLTQPRRVYLSTGIHGDEPAGPMAVRQLLRDDQWPEHIELSVFPCLNPTGTALNRRENAEGIDLNREYLQPKAPETLAHIAWLERQSPFDLCLCLHEDWESQGFYCYELNPEHQISVAPRMIERVAQVCPIDQSEIIEGRPAENGIIRPNIDPRTRPQWPEAFYLITNKTRLSYTLEAPSDFPLNVRVNALVQAVRAALIPRQDL